MTTLRCRIERLEKEQRFKTGFGTNAFLKVSRKSKLRLSRPMALSRANASAIRPGGRANRDRLVYLEKSS